MSEGAARYSQRRAETRDQIAGQPGGSGQGNLLAQHRPDYQFKPVPGAGNAKAGACRDEVMEKRILAEMRRDRVRVGSQVEDPAQAGDDVRQDGKIWRVDCRADGMAAGGGFD